MKTDQLFANLPNLENNSKIIVDTYSPYPPQLVRYILISMTILYYVAILICIGFVFINLIHLFIWRKDKEKAKKAFWNIGLWFVGMVAVIITFFILNLIFTFLGITYF